MSLLRRVRRSAAASALAALAAGCTQSTDPTPLPPTQVPAIVEEFSGTVPLRSNSFNTFDIRRSNGQLTVTLTSTVPGNVAVGLGIGTPAAGGCVLIPQASVTTQAGSVPQLESVSAPAGTYCVVVGDPGNLTAPVTYAVRVTHY